MDDYFITIKNHVEVTEYIEKSRFISQAFSISSEEEAFERISTIKKHIIRLPIMFMHMLLERIKKYRKVRMMANPAEQQEYLY